MFTLQQYEILLSIYQTGQLTKVAKQLQLSQPTITFHIKKMEQKSNLALFEYHGRRTTLSSTGRALLPYAQQILQIHNQTKQIIQDIQHEKQGSIIIGASNTVANTIIPSTLPKIFAQFPDIDLSILKYNTRTIRQLVHDFTIDIGIIIAHKEDIEDVAAIPIKEDPIGIAINVHHPFAHYPLHDPSVLVNERFLLRDQHSTSTKTFRSWCQKANITCRYETEIQSAEAIKKALLTNSGIAVVSRLSIEEEIKSGLLIFKEIEAKNRRSVYLIHHPQRRLSPLQQSMIALIQAMWGDYQKEDETTSTQSE